MNCRAFWGQRGGGPPDRACRVLDNHQDVAYPKNKGSTIRKGRLQSMARKRHAQQTHVRKPTPTFLLELPLQVTSSQAKRLRAHLGAARQLYHAVLSQGQRRLRRMRADGAWQT